MPQLKTTQLWRSSGPSRAGTARRASIRSCDRPHGPHPVEAFGSTDKGFDIRPTIAVTKAPSICPSARRPSTRTPRARRRHHDPGRPVAHHQGGHGAVWYLPGIAQRLVTEQNLRESSSGTAGCQAHHASGPQSVPASGGCSCASGATRRSLPGHRADARARRVQGSDVFGSDIAPAAPT